MKYIGSLDLVRRTLLAAALTVGLFTGASWGQADGGGGTNTVRTVDNDDDDGVDWGLLGLLGLAGLLGLKRRDDHDRVHTTNAPRV